MESAVPYQNYFVLPPLHLHPHPPMRSPKAFLQTSQDQYVRARENPYFNGLIRNDNSLMDKAPIIEFQGDGDSEKVSRLKSDFEETFRKNIKSETSENVVDLLNEDLVMDIVVEPLCRSSSLRRSNITKPTSFVFPSVQSDLDFDSDYQANCMKESIPRTSEGKEEPGVAKPRNEKSYSICSRKPNLFNIPLPQSAASFYNGNFPHMEIVESGDSIDRLNEYLKARKDDVNAGVPGRFLHVVMGSDIFDIGSVASTIMYAFYLNGTITNDQLCTVPVINTQRANLNAHAELKWLLATCQIDQSSLIFIDEIDLSYYDLFGSLKIVLLNGHKLPTKQEALKGAVVEIFNRREDDSSYSWVETVTVGEDISSCTLVAEKLALASPEILAGQGFSRLLLAGILLDTGNLTSPRCTAKDKYMATLLINGAGRFGCNGLYQILRYKLYDVSDLKVTDILRKDFKKWKRVGKPDTASSRVMVSHIGMSSVGISIGQLLAHEITSTQEIKYFQQLERLRLLMIVSGYYDTEKNFKREILISAESVELMKNLLFFFNSNSSQLPLKVLNQPGLKDEMRAFEIDRVMSRKTIELLLEEFGSTSRG